MTKIAKRIAKNKEGIDRSKLYSLAEAVKLVKARAN
ncbi:MAG: 50S ribosomal protein L1, partial [Alphaproteobacteria bacterium]|nr:50S ribosomal protein L1 [Alphaproteobacteria bacterium]